MNDLKRKDESGSETERPDLANDPKSPGKAPDKMLPKISETDGHDGALEHSSALVLSPKKEPEEIPNGTKMSQKDSKTEGSSSLRNSRSSFSEPQASSVAVSSAASPLSTGTSSPPNFLQVTGSLSTPTKGSTMTGRSVEGLVTVKTEPQDDIKDYVETTMNELLGWYGLPKMDKSDTPQLTLGAYPSPLPASASASASASATVPPSQRSPSRPSSATTSATPTTNATTTTTAASVNVNANSNCSRSHVRASRRTKKSSPPDTKLANDTNNNSSSCGGDDEDDDFDDGLDDDDDDDDLDDDFGDDPDDLGDSISAGSDLSAGGFVSPGIIGGGVHDSERGVAIVCSWCQKQGTKLFTLGTPTGVKSFCSELCFTQCRRASFKKNKVCDWCKHVRHTVNFVDFLDGDIQLQFCSEKCLNQYKMNIFCTEARQHLQQIQNMAGEDSKKLRSDGRSDRREEEILITPELWLSGHSDDKVTVKDEVNDEGEDKRVGSDREDVRSSGKVREEDGAGMIRDREKAKRAAALELGVRAVLSDDSSCSNEERVGLKLSSPSPSASRPRDESVASGLLISKQDEVKNHSDLRYRRDRDRIRKLLIDGKCGTSASSHSKELHNGLSSTSTKDKTNKYSHSSPQKQTGLASPRLATSGSADQASTSGLLPNWATSQLLAMMPPHVSSSLAAANINSGLGGLGYASNPLLYSSLFGPGAPLVMGAHKENAAAAAASTVKSRHESRRELLRDRDRSHETERGERKRESSERSAPAVPVSPSTSHSSSDTPGPASTPGVKPGIAPATDLAMGFMPNFARHLPHPLLSGDINQSLLLPHYFTDPALAGMFQLPAGFNLNHHAHHGLAPPPASALPPQHPPPPHHQHRPEPSPAVTQPVAPPQPQPQTPLLPQPSGVPPVTVLVPYPVAIPVPIPIPIPLPIAPEKLFAFLREKAEQARAAPNTPRWPTTDTSADHGGRSSTEGRSRTSSISHIVNPSPVVSPRPSSKSSSVGCLPYGSTSSLLDAADSSLALPSGRESADSIMTLRREIGRSQLKAASTSPCCFSSLKRTITPNLQHTGDLSKRARMDCTLQHSEDEAMDLSKLSSRSDSPRKSGNSSEMENGSLERRMSHSDSDIDTSSHPQNLKVPRIHIISDRAEPPLCQPPVSVALPPPMEQSNYSSRRSRILDAPSVPRRSRSPTPERRYVRTVPRDMVEAARRRGLRARVRSK